MRGSSCLWTADFGWAIVSDILMSNIARQIIEFRRPRYVEDGIRILYASLLLAFVVCIGEGFQKYTDSRSLVGEIGSDAFALGLPLFLVLKISRGQNWARIAFLGLFLLGIILIVGFDLTSFGRARLKTQGLSSIYGILQTLIQAWALVLLFKPESNTWFNSRRLTV
ncbi:MAG TPA: hypothetical protein VN939_06530 [Chthoniobacterales bacterium]|nr:hypothetical protein [Chthoniobacterales bacterium]